jgi:Flp pilus assembly protein TadG
VHRPHRDERGLSESVQFALVWPVLMLVTLGILQAGIWLHARNVAHRVVTAAVDTARGSAGSLDEARELGADLARAGGLGDVTLQVSRGPRSVTATVTGEAPLVLDLGLGRVQETASAPLERVTPP